MGTFCKFIDLTGKQFSRLTVIELASPLVKKSGKKETRWLCRCSCGNITKVLAYNIKNGTTKSCGCLSAEIRGSGTVTHGFSNHPLYSVFHGMKDRCYNKKCEAFKNYGGRGITVCDEWINNPKSFFEWAIQNNYAKNLQINRINNNKDYSPDNCDFITRLENMKNTRLLRSTNTSGYRGVSFYSKRASKYKKWSAIVRGKSIGWFKTAIDAAKYRDKYVIDNNLNLPLNFKIGS